MDEIKKSEPEESLVVSLTVSGGNQIVRSTKPVSKTSLISPRLRTARKGLEGISMNIAQRQRIHGAMTDPSMLCIRRKLGFSRKLAAKRSLS